VPGSAPVYLVGRTTQHTAFLFWLGCGFLPTVFPHPTPGLPWVPVPTLPPPFIHTPSIHDYTHTFGHTHLWGHTHTTTHTPTCTHTPHHTPHTHTTHTYHPPHHTPPPPPPPPPLPPFTLVPAFPHLYLGSWFKFRYYMQAKTAQHGRPMPHGVGWPGKPAWQARRVGANQHPPNYTTDHQPEPPVQLQFFIGAGSPCPAGQATSVAHHRPPPSHHAFTHARVNAGGSFPRAHPTPPPLHAPSGPHTHTHPPPPHPSWLVAPWRARACGLPGTMPCRHGPLDAITTARYAHTCHTCLHAAPLLPRCRGRTTGGHSLQTTRGRRIPATTPRPFAHILFPRPSHWDSRPHGLTLHTHLYWAHIPFLPGLLPSTCTWIPRHWRADWVPPRAAPFHGAN